MTDVVETVALSEADLARLDGFVGLVSDFLEGRSPPEKFELAYFELFKGDPTHWPESIYAPLNEIFLDLDEFVEDPILRGDDPFSIDEAELRRRVRIAFAALRSAQVAHAPQP